MELFFPFSLVESKCKLSYNSLSSEQNYGCMSELQEFEELKEF